MVSGACLLSLQRCHTTRYFPALALPLFALPFAAHQQVRQIRPSANSRGAVAGCLDVDYPDIHLLDEG
jgi:hypothetical protein